MEKLIKRLKSRTYWLGFATFALGGLETAQATGAVPELFDGKVRAVITIAVAVAIFILRELTTGAVADK